MLSHWNKILTTDCIVIKIGQHTVYPIFRVGHTSLMATANEQYTNKQISKCKHIDILIRNPDERFVSGLNEYSRQNNLEVYEAWKLVEQEKLIDRHFIPQYMWLLHLHKFYNDYVTLRPFPYINEFTNIHVKKDKKEKIAVEPIDKFVDVDHKLMQHYHKQIKLGELITRYKNVLS